MKRLLLATAFTFGTFVTGASAQVELKTYADANGYIDVQKLTCAQLANTFCSRSARRGATGGRRDGGAPAGLRDALTPRGARPASTTAPARPAGVCGCVPDGVAEAARSRGRGDVRGARSPGDAGRG